MASSWEAEVEVLQAVLVKDATSPGYDSGTAAPAEMVELTNCRRDIGERLVMTRYSSQDTVERINYTREMQAFACQSKQLLIRKRLRLSVRVDNYQLAQLYEEQEMAAPGERLCATYASAIIGG